MKPDLRILSATLCALGAGACAVRPVADRHSGSAPFVTFTQALIKSEPLTLVKIAKLADRLSIKHGVPVTREWQQEWHVTTENGDEFDFGDGIVVSDVWMNYWATTIDFSKFPCTRVDTLKRLFGPSWQPNPMPDNPHVEFYSKGAYHALVGMSPGLKAECVVRFEITRHKFSPQQ